MDQLKKDLEVIKQKFNDCTTIADSFDQDHEQQRIAWLKKSEFWNRIAAYMERLARLEDDGK